MPEHTPAPTHARSLYGFFLFILSKIFLFLYCSWAFLPNNVLHYFNIYYYPQKYWAYAVPFQLLLGLTLFAFFIYPSVNLMLSVNIDNPRTITDSYSICEMEQFADSCIKNECICKDKRRCHVLEYNPNCLYENEGLVPHIKDLDIRLVCKKLYY